MVAACFTPVVRNQIKKIITIIISMILFTCNLKDIFMGKVILLLFLIIEMMVILIVFLSSSVSFLVFCSSFLVFCF